MDPQGKYIWIPLTPNELAEVLALGPTEEIADQIGLMGKIVGETTALGLWIQIESCFSSSMRTEIFPQFSEVRPIQLVVWRYINSARLFDERPKTVPIGFRWPTADS